jgi:hypothetical protein
MRHVLSFFIIIALCVSILPDDAKAISYYDNYDAWAIAVNEPITAACTSGPECFATSPFGVPGGAGGFSGPDHPFAPNAWVSDDMDIYRLGVQIGSAAQLPIFRGVAFSGTGITLHMNSNPSWGGQTVFALNIFGLQFMNTTGFIGFVDDEPFRLGAFSSASRTASFITAMYFDSASAPGFQSTLQVPEPSVLLQMILAVLCLAVFAFMSSKKTARTSESV